MFPIWPKEEEEVSKTRAAANISGREQAAVEREDMNSFFSGLMILQTEVCEVHQTEFSS